MDYLRSMIERLEDRVLSLEEQFQSEYREQREIIFESDWQGFSSDEEDDDDDED